MKNCINKIALATLILSTQKMNAELNEFIQNLNDHKLNASMCFKFRNASLKAKEHLNSCHDSDCPIDHQKLARSTDSYLAGAQQDCQLFFKALKEQEALAQKHKNLIRS
jgi:hypothetical protein